MEKQLLQFYLGLPQRKREVLYWAVCGLSNAEIAEKLCIESGSVADHLTDIYGDLATMEMFAHYPKVKRPLLISTFAVFFDKHNDLFF
jgi:FixJ family two-component response regulator